MAHLFEELRLRSVTLKNRIAVSPMCEYSAVDGMPNDWHLVHLGSRAVGQCGLLFTEATAVEPDGRISPGDTEIYTDEQTRAWARIVDFIDGQGSVAGIQLAHAGRKASTGIPWEGGQPVPVEKGGWSPIWSSSAIPFNEGWQVPAALDEAGIERIRKAFVKATQRSIEAGFKVIELHMAHGYLFNQFMSPLINHRDDAYGGSRENRMRFSLETIEAVRAVIPDDLPLVVRISASDWAEGGWTLVDSTVFAREAKKRGVDLVDCSSGGAVPNAKIELGPGYQVPFAEAIRRDADILTGAVGLITEPLQAEEILASGQADLIFLARELLRDPYWPRRAARELGVEPKGPKQYGRAW